VVARVLRHDRRLESLQQVVLAEAHQAQATLAEARRRDGSTGALVAHHRITSRGRTSNGPWLLRQSRSHQPGRAVQALSLRLGGRHRRHEEPTFRTTPGSTRQRRELGQEHKRREGHPPTREARRACPARRDPVMPSVRQRAPDTWYHDRQGGRPRASWFRCHRGGPPPSPDGTHHRRVDRIRLGQVAPTATRRHPDRESPTGRLDHAGHRR
jgi:hypothetical protein